MSNKTYEKLDPEIINQFRDKINDGFIYFLFSNYRNKDMWNIMCSAMDWIETSVDGIEPSRVLNAEGLEASRQMMLFISCVDVLCQGVKELSCIFYRHPKNGKVFARAPFYEYAECGNVRSYFSRHKDDDVHFSTIRACFVAHPIELDGTVFKNQHRVASWTSDGFMCDDADYRVTLYGQEPNVPNIYLQVYFDELMTYAKQKHEHLLTIIDEAERKSQAYINFFSGKILAKHPGPSERWAELEDIIKKREDSDNILNDYEFVNLELLFKTSISNPNNATIVDMYRSLIHKCVSSQYHDKNLEKMNLNTFTFSPETLWACPSQHFPEYQSFCNLLFWEQIYFYGDYMSSKWSCTQAIADELNVLEWTVQGWIENNLTDVIELKTDQGMKFLEHSGKEELYVLTRVGLFFKQHPHLYKSGGVG